MKNISSKASQGLATLSFEPAIIVFVRVLNCKPEVVVVHRFAPVFAPERCCAFVCYLCACGVALLHNLRFVLLFFWMSELLLHVFCMSEASLSEVPIVSGLAQQLQGIFPEEPSVAVQTAVADGLLRAIGDEGIDLQEVSCNRDYSHLCPEGVPRSFTIEASTFMRAPWCVQAGLIQVMEILVWRQQIIKARGGNCMCAYLRVDLLL